MNYSQEIIKQAENLMQAGNSEDAREMLLREGYFKQLDPVVQQALLSWFPQPVAFNQEVQTATEDLFSSDVLLRRKASKYIALRALRGMPDSLIGVSVIIESWIRDPRTVDIFLKALGDSDAKVVADITIALGMFCLRYDYPDIRIYNHVENLFDHPSSEVKINAVTAIKYFPYSEKWDYIHTLLEKKPSIRTKLIIGQTLIEYGETMNKTRKNKFLNKIVELYKKEKNNEVKSRFMNALRFIGDSSIIPFLKDSLELERDSFQLGEISSTIQSIQG